jgi:hypothetical protein
MSSALQPSSEALLFMLETHICYEESGQHRTYLKPGQIVLTAQSEAEGSATAKPAAASRAKAIGEKDFIVVFGAKSRQLT